MESLDLKQGRYTWTESYRSLDFRTIPTFDDVVFFDQLMRVRLASLYAKLEAGGPGQSDEPVIEPASLK